MWGIDTKVETKTTSTINGKDANEVLGIIAGAAHRAFLYTSTMNDEYNNGKPMDHELVECIEGCLCEILDSLGD